MKKKKSAKGLSGLAISIIWALVSLGAVLAAIQALGADSPEGIVSKAQEKAAYYAECIPAGECGLALMIKNLGNSDGPNLDLDASGNPVDSDNPSNPETDGPSNPGTNSGSAEEDSSEPVLNDNEPITRDVKGYRGPSKGEPYVNNVGLVAKNTALSLLAKLNVSNSTEIEYNRSEWKHWSSTEGKACWSTREEILNRDAEEGTVTYVDKKMNVTTNYSDACAIGTPVKEDGKLRVDTVNSGEWVDPYSGKSISSASDLDIDHIVPLKYAAENGGQSWSEGEKEKFANDPDNLLATSAKENRSKGAKGPSDYMPPYKAYRCQYSKSFVGVASKYNLSIQKKDLNVLNKTLSDCEI